MIKFFHAPHSRSSGILWILEELEVSYEMHLVDIRSPSGAPESYREIQPHKKVPAIVHDGVTITESAAIGIYVGDLFPKGTLTPQPGDARRGPYLSWLVYLSAVYDPALTAAFKGWNYKGSEVSFGKFEDTARYIERTLERAPFLLGKEVTLADFQLSGALYWALDVVHAMEDEPYLRDYIARVQDRPSFARYQRTEQRLLEAMQKAG